MNRGKKTQTVEESILKSVLSGGHGSIFVPVDFLRLGSREAVDVGLHRLVKRGVIRRLARGLYDYPREHPVLGLLWPSAEAIAQALAGRDRTRLQPAGAFAANLLGLTDQVPAKVVFLTDGPSRTVKVGPMTIQLRRTTPRAMSAAGRFSGLLIQALRELGEPHVTPERVAPLRRTIPLEKRRELLRDVTIAPAWMRPIFQYLAEASE
jgi:hypothetical protein